MSAPLIVSFSGGRTSAYMLRRLLDEGRDVLPVFANTGKERPETLDFINECAVRWGIDVVWLEFDLTPDSKDAYRVVNHATADRDGGPFAALCERVGMVPNSVFRFCTDRLKIMPIRRYLKDRFGTLAGLEMAIGIRADERHRGKAKHAAPKSVFPLMDAGITVEDVTAFWQSQPFDLRLHGTSGNCDLCFLKRRGVLVDLIRRNPESADWWAGLETRHGDVFKRPYSYADMKRMATAMRLFDDADDNESLTCFCTD